MPTVDDVQSFWDANPCGSDLVEPGEGWSDAHAEARYTLESHIPEIARFGEFRDRDVLEIGCGIGADALQFARHGARYTGVDLSERSVAMTRARFEEAGLNGRFLVTDAERLPFDDASFDHVYSFGVIHHSPDTEAIVAEIRRVLRPGGTVTVMVYNRASINYRVEIMVLRKVFKRVLTPPWAPRLVARLTGLPGAKLERHREMYLAHPDVTAEQWVSMNTDGPDCPVAKVYDEGEAAALFRDFDDVRQEVRFFDWRHWPFLGPALPDSARRALGRRWGWHRVIRARKPG